jgi:hypothetical protein
MRTATLPLHYGSAPKWLMDRMIKLGRAICEAVVIYYGRDELLKRLSDPFWFQSLGCILGFDWHSSGVTTTVCGAIKFGLAPLMDELGVYVCGGKGKRSLKTPEEILFFSEKNGFDGDFFVRISRLSAKVDSICLQDGFELYHHTFIFTKDGKWAVIQQGMCPEMKIARRYHWFSEDIKSMVEEPHSAVCCDIKRKVLNLVHRDSRGLRERTLNLTMAVTSQGLSLIMPKEHEIKDKKITLKKIEETLRKVVENNPQTFEELILIKGLGKESMRALVLLAELIFGEKPSFEDPVRFSFAHGGKDGHPYPVKRELYDKTIYFMEDLLRKAKINPVEKDKAFKSLKLLLSS